MTSRIFSFFEDSQLVLKPYKNHWGKHRAHRARQRKQGNRKGWMPGWGNRIWGLYVKNILYQWYFYIVWVCHSFLTLPYKDMSLNAQTRGQCSVLFHTWVLKTMNIYFQAFASLVVYLSTCLVICNRKTMSTFYIHTCTCTYMYTHICKLSKD